jgi:hypothetical protein
MVIPVIQVKVVQTDLLETRQPTLPVSSRVANLLLLMVQMVQTASQVKAAVAAVVAVAKAQEFSVAVLLRAVVVVAAAVPAAAPVTLVSEGMPVEAQPPSCLSLPMLTSSTQPSNWASVVPAARAVTVATVAVVARLVPRVVAPVVVSMRMVVPVVMVVSVVRAVVPAAVLALAAAPRSESLSLAVAPMTPPIFSSLAAVLRTVAEPVAQVAPVDVAEAVPGRRPIAAMTGVAVHRRTNLATKLQ